MPFSNLLIGNHPEIIIRVIVSIILGFTIGIERELTNKSAGLRTHILVCLGSTVFTILSIYGFSPQQLVPVAANPDTYRIVQDPARIAAQIITGIGFIGGGAVLHHGVSISGLTTAASLWITAAVGMAVGTGSYPVAVVAAILTLVVLVAVRKLEVGFLAKHTRKGARIKVAAVVLPDHITDIQDWFYREFVNIIEMNVGKKCIKDEDYMKVTFIIDIFDADPISKTYHKLKELKNIESLTLQQVIDEE